MSFYSIDFKSHEKLYDHIWNTTKNCTMPPIRAESFRFKHGGMAPFPPKL